ncbi:hypothetical protein AVEN_246302-1 [Araneus ventricosus]|uniref:Uncharacterized protein n=1 Tax=Araneus ventricosus TaxID=182803 RepID=A0A4Y2HVL7_ARAVE|nr:hypothetical protein AVEN_246302-1 [Araneus ventricosus]
MNNNWKSGTKLKFIPNLNKTFELVFKNEYSTLISRNKIGYLLSALGTQPARRCGAAPALHERHGIYLNAGPTCSTWLGRNLVPSIEPVLVNCFHSFSEENLVPDKCLEPRLGAESGLWLQTSHLNFRSNS